MRAQPARTRALARYLGAAARRREETPDTFFGPGRRGRRIGVRRALRREPAAPRLAGFTAANVANASLKMLVDPNFGAAHLNFFVVQYADGGLIKEHDHAFEEAYFFLQGEIEVLADGEARILRAGDYRTGIGCPHAFTNRSGKPVRWVETQVPQPPVREAALQGRLAVGVGAATLPRCRARTPRRPPGRGRSGAVMDREESQVETAQHETPEPARSPEHDDHRDGPRAIRYQTP
jgi:quercetin dioxygenase-like cupin family protein